MGEYLIREHARQAGLEVEVASSAITDYEIGNPIDTRAGRILTARGIDPSGHRASRFVVEDFDRYDLILAMDTPHYLHLKQLARTEDDKAKIRMMRSFDPAMAGKKPGRTGHLRPLVRADARLRIHDRAYRHRGAGADRRAKRDPAGKLAHGCVEHRFRQRLRNQQR